MTKRKIEHLSKKIEECNRAIAYAKTERELDDAIMMKHACVNALMKGEEEGK